MLAQISATFPLATRYTSIPLTSIRFPEAGIPMKSPKWVE